MSLEEFTKGMMILSTSYGKDLTQEQLKIWYGFINDIDYKNFQEAIKNIILNNKFFPSVADIREEVKRITENKKESNFWEVIEKMKQDSYFKNETEIDKIVKWYSEGIIPTWLRTDMESYGLCKELAPTKQYLLN